MSKITDNVLEDIFDTAMEGGITYWCGFREGSFIDIIAGNAVTLTCTDDEEEFELTKDKLLAGIKMYLDETGDTELDPDDIDACSADEIVQYAIFGELMYS